MNKTALRKRSLLVTTTAALWLLLACLSCDSGEEPPASDGIDSNNGATMQLSHYDFTPQEASNIIGNRMHDVHNKSNGIDCTQCHRSEEWITHQQALDLCIECHEERIVAADIWHNHCISCHQFTNFAEAYADSTHVLRELCQDCHGLESVIYTAFVPESPHDITCDNCHHPHETSLVYSGALCETCHEEITDVVSPENRVHGSCLVCHTPHSPMSHSSELCSKCHYASQDILVHNVPDHPTDCLACHNAHITHVEIGDQACQICHDETFYGGESQLPLPHKDCSNCHVPSNFVYKGDQACIRCHIEEDSVLEATDLPEQHRHCTTCHEPHHWYARYEFNCERCHEVDKVIEHNLDFHKHECSGCHNPHSIQTMAKSGNCNGCHTDRDYLHFRPDMAQEHLTCENCHSKVAIDSRRFTFLGPANSCMLCHSSATAEGSLAWNDVPFGHRVCDVCHQPHTFELTRQADSCNLCHVDVFGSFPGPAHAECTNCHDGGHQPHLLQPEDTCDVCHSDIFSELNLNSNHPRDCIACHEVHQGRAENTCDMCHQELPGLHTQHLPADNPVFSCATCHIPHLMGANTASCSVCHSDLPESCGENCLDCHSYRKESP